MPRKIKDELNNEAAGEPGLYAYADFEIDGVSCKEGDRFEPPAGWQRDPAADELLSASKRKNGARTGLAFSYLGEVINPGGKNIELRERKVLKAVLPLEER